MSESHIQMTHFTKKAPIQSYRDRWQTPDGQLEWDAFHHAWWGKPGQEKLAGTDLLLVQPQTICEYLGIESDLLFQRNEYKAFNNRIRYGVQNTQHVNFSGCLLLGQPGIGKSVFLFFFLLICMSKEEITLFTNSTGFTFLINKKDVLVKRTENFDIHDLPDSPIRIWSLVDSPEQKIPLTRSVTRMHPRKIFFVAALSPDSSRYKEVEKKPSVRTWWMSPWKDEELLTLLNNDPALKDNENLKSQFENLPAVQSLMEQVGPCPRDMIQQLLDPDNIMTKILQALEDVRNLEDLVNLIRNPFNLSNGEISHNIILVQRQGPVLEMSLKSDVPYVRLKTLDIQRRTMERYNKLELNEAERLFRICAGIGPKGAAFSGNLFEGLAIRYTSGEEPASGPGTFGPFVQMTKAKTKSKKFPIRYTYGRPDYKRTIIVDPDHVVLKGSPRGSDLTPSYGIRARPWSPRARVEYKQDVQIDDSSYYCPSRHNNLLFDAFFFEVLPFEKVILWVLQMTTSRDHGGAKSGFDIVDTVKMRASSSWSLTVEVKYVLVVAYKEPGLNVQWNFSSGFKKCPGEVFIQELDLDVFGGRSFELEDIYETESVETIQDHPMLSKAEGKRKANDDEEETSTTEEGTSAFNQQKKKKKLN